MAIEFSLLAISYYIDRKSCPFQEGLCFFNKWIKGKHEEGLKYTWAMCSAPSYLTPCSHVNYSLPDSSVHGIFQARMLK